MEKRVILLNGPSSSGKSTLAAALRDLIEQKRGERFAVVSIDSFLRMSARDAIYEDDVYEIHPALCRAAQEALRTAPGVILDHVITSERIFSQCMALLRPCRLCLVRVTCPPEELEKREQARPDRCPGSAAASARYLFPKDGYDLTVDTMLMTPAQCARRVFLRAFSTRDAVRVEEIPVGKLDEFWPLHIRYLTEDGIITDEEDAEYFSGQEYRGILEAHMRRDRDRHRMVWFVRGGQRIGAASYCIYNSEDGKCFILDFWVFPEFRGRGTGHRCFAALERYAAADGARYFELNSEKEASVRFWKSLGFVDNGQDEYGMALLIRK